MAFCLIKPMAEEFKQRLKNGEITPQKLNVMTSAERHAYFAEFMGENNAREVNALFESKLLLKNQQQGMINWAKRVANITPEVRRDLILRIEKMDKILTSKEQETFLQDLASKRLGAEVTFNEAQRITELSQKVAQTKEEMLKNVENKEKRIEYGNAVIDLGEYVSSINPKKASFVANVANIPKTVMSTLDFSAPFRQGWGMMTRKEFWGAFKDMFKYAFSEKAYKDMRADIVSRPTYNLMKGSGLRVNNLGENLSQREEQFISSLLDKVPGIKGSERAYAGFLAKLRADVFDNLIKKAELRGEDVGRSNQVTRDIANVVNDFTGSGNIGKNDKYSNTVPLLNSVFFSPRKLSATVNMFNPERYLNPNVSPTARQAAIRQLVGSLSATAIILGIASLIGASVEKDPRSSDFAKIKLGKTRLDISGGNGPYSVLISRMISNQTKSTTTGNIKTLGKGYKSDTRYDVGQKFIRNKLSPLVSAFVDVLYGADSGGNKATISNELKSRVVPLIITDTLELIKKDPKMAIVGALADMFGAGVQNY